jgi:hypothetical protein
MLFTLLFTNLVNMNQDYDIFGEDNFDEVGLEK